MMKQASLSVRTTSSVTPLVVCFGFTSSTSRAFWATYVVSPRRHISVGPLLYPSSTVLSARLDLALQAEYW